VQAAAKILGVRADELIKPIPGQDIRIYDAEDPDSWPQWILEKIEVRKRRAAN